MRIIDLSMTIKSMWRWNVESEFIQNFDIGDSYQTTMLKIGMHSFTHIDTPLHIEPNCESIDKISIENLCGSAAVIDLTSVEENQEIKLATIKEKSKHIRENDIVILKTCWDRLKSYSTVDYWSESPYLNRESSLWLSELPIKAIGFDFPQDYAIREIPKRHPPVIEMPTHDLILRKGIFLIEYLCNLNLIKSERIEIFALPIKVANCEAACARVIAIDE